jgi:diaminopropionate ammonia-lyase
MRATATGAATMFLNPERSAYLSPDRDLIGQQHARQALPFIALSPEYRVTPLESLAGLARQLDLGSVYLKAEWSRMGLPSFKALGGMHAVALLLKERAEAQLDRPLAPEELRTAAVQAVARDITLICASAGNHGLAVAEGANLFGARAVICLSDQVPEIFAQQLRERGATVLRSGASYEDSMAFAAAEAERHGWELVSDSSWSGYAKIPLDVMRGYTVLLDEAAEAMEANGGPASHVVVQAGVGGLAAAAAGYLRDRWGEHFTLAVIEAEGAPCLQASIRARRSVRVQGTPTRLGRLDCKEPSLLAFDMLRWFADAFATVSDAEAESAAEYLNTLGLPVSACAAAGAAGLIALCQKPLERQQLRLRPDSRVLLIATEAATPDSHA